MNGSIGYPTFRWFMASTVTIGYLVIGILLIAPSTIIGIIAKEEFCRDMMNNSTTIIVSGGPEKTAVRQLLYGILT